MKADKQQKMDGDQASIQQSINGRLAGGKKFLKSTGGRSRKLTDGKEAFTIPSGMASEHGFCSSNKGTTAGTVAKMPTVIEQEEDQMAHPAAKIKLQLFPLDDTIRRGLEKDGHNPFLELTLRPRKKISSVVNHLCSKWGSSTVAEGELTLFPFNVTVDNVSSSLRWTSSDVFINAGDVHAAIGSPEIFRLRYWWISTHLNSLGSSPSLGCVKPGHVERICSSKMENAADPMHQADVKNTISKPHCMNSVTNVAVEHISVESHSMVCNQAEATHEDLDPSGPSRTENDPAVEEKPSAEQFKYEDSRFQSDVSLTSLLWSDLSNISIGGLLSEASLQGRFSYQDSKPGGGLASQPAVVSDSMDAFINQITCAQSSTTLSPEMPSSILDAEDTCHSFALHKQPFSAGKEFLTLGRRAFSELSNQGDSIRPFKCPKSEANGQDGATVKSADEDQKTDPVPSSGLFSSENSLGLSNIRWNDSLGPFDIPLASRQITKDDSISIGGFVR